MRASSCIASKCKEYWLMCHPQLSKYPALNNLEKQTSVPKVYAALGLVATYFFFIFFNIGGQLLTNFAGFVIPGYYSMEALFSVGKTDDTQWLTVRTPNPLPQMGLIRLYSTGLSLLSSPSLRAWSMLSTGSHSTTPSSSFLSSGSLSQSPGKLHLVCAFVIKY